VNELRTADYLEGAPILKGKLLIHQPGIAWFHDTGTCRNYLQYAEGIDTDIPWGVLKHSIGKTRVFQR
jgi:hypothetical protein